MIKNLFIETEADGHVKIVYGVERVRELEQKEKSKIKNKKNNKTKIKKNKNKK